MSNLVGKRKQKTLVLQSTSSKFVVVFGVVLYASASDLSVREMQETVLIVGLPVGCLGGSVHNTPWKGRN